MNTIKLIALLFALTVASACSTTRAELTDWSDVAEQLVEPQSVRLTSFALRSANGADEANATWFSVCEAKECDPEAVEYSRTFREAALLAEAVRQAERFTPVQAASFGVDADRCQELANRISVLKMEIDWMTPEADLEPELQDRAKRGIALASQQLTFAAAHVSRLARSTEMNAAVASAE